MKQDEAALQYAVYRYLSMANLTVYCEIPFMSRRIDLVISEKELIKVIEFKIWDWKKAIEQLRTHRIASHYSYLCIPKRNIKSNLVNALNTFGFGLYFWDNNKSLLTEYIKPRLSPVVNPHAVNKLKTNLQAFCNGH